MLQHSFCWASTLDEDVLPSVRQAAVAEDDTVVTSQASGGGGSGSGHHRRLSRGSGPWSRRESRPPRLARAPPPSDPRQGLQALKNAFIESGGTFADPPAATPQVRATLMIAFVQLRRADTPYWDAPSRLQCAVVPF